MDKIDQLLKRRARTLILAGGAFALWQGFFLVADILPQEHELQNTIAFGVIAGALLWVGAMISLMLFWRQVAKEKAKASLDDELTRHNRFKAFAYAWVYTLAAVVLGVGAETIWTGSAYISLRVAQIVAISVPMIAFAQLELKDLKQ